MTEEQQKIAVAEALGWKRVNLVTPEFWRLNDAGIIHHTTELPDYPNDANTRGEMWGNLTQAQKREFVLSLLGAPHIVHYQVIDVIAALDLNQPTFCRHWLKVVGKWKEGV